MTQGGVAGGHTLFLKGGKLHYVYNFLGIEEQVVISTAVVPKGEVILGVKLIAKRKNLKAAPTAPQHYTSTTRQWETQDWTQPGKFALAGEGLVIGRLGADSVRRDYKAPSLLPESL